MANDLTIGARLKDALYGPCRYFLMAAGVFAIISAYFVFTKPHFESGGHEYYPWIILYDAFIIPLAITKALLACALISFLYKAILHKNSSIIACAFMLAISLVWSFLASNHPDDISLHIYSAERTKMIIVHHTFTLKSLRLKEDPIVETFHIRENNRSVKLSCTLGSWWYFGNLRTSSSINEYYIKDNPELAEDYCEPSV